MMIDVHTHVGRGGAIVAAPKDLVASMDRAGIDRSLVFAGSMNRCSTADLIIMIAPWRSRLIGVGSVSPLAKDRPSPRQVKRWLDDGLISGLKFYPGYEYFYPADRRLRPYLRLLAERGRPAIFHSGDTYNAMPSAKLKYAHPLAIDDLAVALPGLKIVIAHLGYPWAVDAAEVCCKNANVYADTSGFVYGKFSAAQVGEYRRFVGEFDRVAGPAGRSKVLFGTDWPIGDQRSYLSAVRSVFGERRLAAMNRAAEGLFGIE